MRTAASIPRIVISGASFRAAQLLHAVGIVVVPLIGTIVALLFAWTNGVGAIDMALLIAFYTLSILGITVGFHRHFAHRAFATSRGVRFFLGVLGSLAAQGPLTYWVSNHRRHHRFSDREGDPHSPHVAGTRLQHGLRGFLHAHMGWTLDDEVTNTAAFSTDLMRDPLAVVLNRTYYVWVLLGVVLPAVIGGALTASWRGAVSGLLWGGLVRLFVSYHATNSINSLGHLFGSRPFQTRDASRNNALLVLPTLGEGLHNNHHAFPASALFGLTWWHFDLGAWLILALERIGLVWDVRRPQRAQSDVPQTVSTL